MLNPDRKELRLQPAVPETPKKNGHIPRWLRVPAFAIRTSLAILTTAPGVVIATDTLNRIEHSSVVYNSGQDVTVNSQFDLDPTPPPSATVQPLEVYKLYLNSALYVIRGFRDEANFRGDFPIDKSRVIGNWGRTDIRLKAGQTLEISATGRVNTQPFIYGADPYHGSCKDSNVYDPDGNRVWRDNSICPGNSESSLKGVPRVMLVGNIENEGKRYEPWLPIGSHWKERVDRDGRLYLTLNATGHSGGFDISVNVYPLNPTPTSVPPPRLAFTPELIKTAVPTERGYDLSGWLLGAGATFLAGLAWGINRWKRKNLHNPVQQGSTGTGRNVPLGLGGGITEPLGGGPNPNLGPNAISSNPNIGPSQPKNPEWIIGQKDFERKWQAAKSKLQPVQPGDNSNMQGYVLDRFKAGMSIIHEVSLNDATNVPEMDTRVRAGIEYLIPEIWSDDRIFKGFFDPAFNAGIFPPEELAKIIYLPESYRNLSIFTKAQKRDIMRIHRTLLHALHPDLLKKDADPKLQDLIDILLRQINSDWPLIDKLIN